MRRHFFASRSWFPDHLPSCGSGRGTKKDLVAGCDFDTSQQVNECEVCRVLCQHHVRRPPMCFYVALYCFQPVFVHGFGHCCASMRWIKSICLFAHVFFTQKMCDCCCVGTNSGHHIGFQTIFHAAALVATQKHIALTSPEHGQSSVALRSSIPPSCLHRTRRKQGYRNGLRKRHSVFLDPRKQKNHVFFSMISGSAAPC